MSRRYVNLTGDFQALAVGDYILRHDKIVEDAETGDIEMLLVITDMRLKGPGRSNVRYLAPGKRVELDGQISFHYFIGAQQRLRGVIDAPGHVRVTRVTPQRPAEQ